jgi:predicted alpha/beta hydrolase family esterase
VKRILVIHGWSNHRPAGHWHRELVKALRTQGHVVSYPALPNPELPELEAWLEIVAQELELLGEVDGDELIVVAHSLGVLTWLNLAMQRRVPVHVDRVLLVAPADPELSESFPTFKLEVSKAAKSVADNATTTLIVGSDADQWAPNGVAETFGVPLNVETRLIPGAGHVAMDDGYGYWQGVIDWVNDPTADVTKK